MSFLYPLGLIGLIGIPILIIIYIIKNKYTEQIIPSTFLWTLSEKFLKKRKPISLINGLISLLLQIAIVLVISLLIAHPVLTIPNSAKEYCFIIDGSGSMNTVNENMTRLEIGKEKVKEIINSSTDGSKYTVLFVSDTSKVVYEKITNKEKACELINEIQPLGITINYTNALSYAQQYFNENNSLLTYLITDKNYTVENINIINVNNNEINYGISSLDYIIDGLKLKIYGNIISNNEDQITLDIYVDDVLETKLDVNVNNSKANSFEFISTTTTFTQIKTTISSNDSLLDDNTRIIYNLEKNHNYTTLIISDHPYYLQSIINTIGNITVNTISFDDYNKTGESMTGYSLYIFDSFTPNDLPTDGTIWLFNPSSSIKGAGFSVQDVIENEEGMVLSYPKNSTTLFKTLTKDLEKEDIYVSKYRKYGLHRNFTTLLTHDGNPILFTGTTDNGTREVVFAFDIHNSNVSMLMDFILLTRNLLTYSFPVIIDETSFICGDTVNINVLSNCKSIRIDSPKGNISYLDVSKEVTNFQVNESGTYKISLKLGEGENADMKEMYIFASLPDEEIVSSTTEEKLVLQGEISNNYSDGIYDKLVILFIVLIIIYMIDWMVYCYEQYQLR